MPILLNGATGIQTPLGSAGSPVDSNTTTPTTGVYYPSATTWGVSTAGTNALYIDASQNVGIGTTSPSNKLEVSGSSSNAIIKITDTGSTRADLRLQSSSNMYITFGNSTTFDLGRINYDPSNNMAFYSNSSERMRIDSSGNLLVGTTSNLGSAKMFSTTSGNFGLIAQCGNGNTAIGTTNTSGTSQYTAISFFNNGGVSSQTGTITVSGSNTAYNTSSDYRLKENVAPMTTGLEKISALKPVNYDWISDQSKGEGFIAHELQAVIPHAVTGEKDAVDADGKPVYQGVDYSKIVVHLVAAIQELKAEFDAYKAAHP